MTFICFSSSCCHSRWYKCVTNSKLQSQTDWYDFHDEVKVYRIPVFMLPPLMSFLINGFLFHYNYSQINCFLPFAVECDLAFLPHLCDILIGTLFKIVQRIRIFFRYAEICNSDVLIVPSFIFFFPEKYERLQICRTMCCKKCVGKWDVTFNERNPISQFDSCILAHWSLCFIYFVIPIIHWSLSLWSLWSLWSTDAYHFWSLWVILMVC